MVIHELEAGGSQRLVTYGTSLTAERRLLFRNESGLWVQAVRSRLRRRYPGRVRVVNGARCGATSAWGLRHIERRVLRHRPDAVLIEFAINDADRRHGITVMDARRNLDAMVERIRRARPACTLFLLTMNPSTGRHADARPHLAGYYDVYREAAADNALPLVDLEPAWRHILEAERERFRALVPDGLHPNAAGCREIIVPAVMAALDESGFEREAARRV